MKIKTKQLSAALSECSRAIKARTTLPVLSCVRLEAVNGILTLQSTNLDVWIELRVECEGDLPACCVGMSLLQKLTEYAGTPDVELNLGKRLEFKAGTSASNVNVMQADEFPKWPEGDSEFIAVNCEDLAQGIDSVAWTTIDPSNGRPNLENVHVALSSSAIECAAYNGRVIAFYSQPAISVEKTFQIPHDFTSAFVSALKQPESSLSVSGRGATCSHKNGRTMVKLSELPFPEGWRGVTAKAEDNSFVRVESDVLKLACSHALSLASQTLTATLSLDWRDDGTLVMESTGDIGAYRETAELKNAIGEGYAQLSAAYLMGALSHLGETVKFTPAEGISFWASDNLVVGIGQLGASLEARRIKEFQQS